VIASHYAEPAPRSVRITAILRSSPDRDGEAIAELAPREPFDLLDDSLGWAWGYAGAARRVGYVRSEALS
jgi:hypothetical protein